jgi:cysteine desulfurase
VPVSLDHHATTPCDPRVIDAMLPWFGARAANASSRSHRLGTAAREATEEARAQLAAFVGCSGREVVFTSGATESDNLAILGTLRGWRGAGRPGGHVITVATEHKAVLDPVAMAQAEGFAATVLPVDAQGRVDPEDVRRALRPDTALVSVMLVNNEVGVLQPLAAISAVCRERGVPLHCDAAQAAVEPIPWASLDLVSLSAHKLHGPMGVGALLVRRTRPPLVLAPLMGGGGHERSLRPGTLPVPLCVGFGVAVSLLDEAGAQRVRGLRDALWAGLSAALDGLSLHGPPLGERAGNNLSVSFDGVEANALLLAVREHLALSTGSACTSETLQPSHVLRAMGVPPEVAHRAVRFGLARSTTPADIALAVQVIPEAVRRLRGLSAALVDGP